MAVRDITQYTTVVHIPKEELRQFLIRNDDLSKSALKVFMYLLTDLNGFNTTAREESKKQYTDPFNFKNLDMKMLADELNMEKKKVKKAVIELEAAGIIERGDGITVKNGYRFTF